MATNNRSQVYLDADDGISKVVNNIAQSVNNLNRSLAQMSTASNGSFNNVNQSLSQQIGLLRDINTSIGGIGGAIGSTALKFAGWTAALLGVKSLGESVIGMFSHGVKVNMDVQTATNGIAGLIASLETFTDASGKMVQGPEKFAIATKLAEADVKKLRLAALNTGVNFKEATDAYTQALSPGLSNGMNRDQIMNLSTLTANAAKSMGMNNGMAGQEIRALLSGQIDKNATIGSALGLGPNGPLHDAYEQALKTGKGYDFLQDKLKEFAKAGEQQANSLKGTFDQMGDVFDQFSGAASKSLTDALTNLSKPLNNLFDSKTGDWADSLTPILAVFNEIGDVVGKGIVDAVNSVISLIIDFGSYLNEDQSMLNTIEQVWNAIVEVATSVWNVIKEVFGVIGDVVGAIFNMLGLTQSTGEELTTWQKILLVINGAVQAIAIGFALLQDVIKIVADFVRVALGGAIDAVAMILQGFLKLVAGGLNALNLTDASKAVSDFANKIGTSADQAKQKVVGMNNSLLNAPNMGASAGEKADFFFKNTISQLDKSAKDFDKANDKTNKSYTDWVKKINDQKKASATVTAGSLGVTEKNAYTNKPKEKKEKKGREEDTDKLAYENELKELERQAQAEKDITADKTRYLETDRQFNLVSIQDYFKQKNALEDQDYKTQLDFLNKEIAITESQKANAKNGKDANKLDDKENELLNKKAKLQQDYAFNQHKNMLQQMKDLKDYSNQLLELDAQIDDMTGKTGAARTIRLNIEMDNLKEKYKSDPEALAKIENLQKLKEVQNQFNDIQTDYNNLLDTQTNKEDRINILQKQGSISELDQMNQIKAVRQEYIGQLTDQISKLDAIYNNTKDPAMISQIDKLKNKLLELQGQVDPLKQKFDDLFNTGLVDAFQSFVDGSKTASEAFKDFTGTIEKELLRLATQSALKQLEKTLFGTDGSGGSGGFSFGGLVSSIFGGGSSTTASSATSSSGGGFMSFLSGIGSWIGGFFASGGYTNGNKPIVVGEGGPELFFPGGKGGYIANAPMTQSLLNQGGGAGGNVIQNINITTPNYQSFNNSDNQVGVQMANALSRARRNM